MPKIKMNPCFAFYKCFAIFSSFRKSKIITSKFEVSRSLKVKVKSNIFEDFSRLLKEQNWGHLRLHREKKLP